MARNPSAYLSSAGNWTCRRCRLQSSTLGRKSLLQVTAPRKGFSTTPAFAAEVQVKAAPEIDFKRSQSEAARILPTSPSYFTGAPVFNDHVLKLQELLRAYGSFPAIPPDQVPRLLLMNLSQYRSTIGEKVPSAKYAQALILVRRLNQIHPRLRTVEVKDMIERFRRPGSAELIKAKLGRMDEYGRAKGVGRRKESTARVYLVEGTGETLINGRNLVEAFPRLHDRESALWPLKVTERTHKYNVFALVEGGGVTGQAESVTLALAKALLIHEPALKPALRRAGCVTRIMKRVERKKPGHVKARKKPAWVKR